MSALTLAEYKVLGKVPHSQDDAQIEALIPLVEADYLTIRGRDFDTDDNGQTVYPEGIKLTLAEMISFKMQSLAGNVGTSAERSGSYSHTYDTERTMGYPAYIVKKIRRFARTA